MSNHPESELGKLLEGAKRQVEEVGLVEYLQREFLSGDNVDGEELESQYAEVVAILLGIYVVSNPNKRINEANPERLTVVANDKEDKNAYLIILESAKLSIAKVKES